MRADQDRARSLWAGLVAPGGKAVAPAAAVGEPAPAVDVTPMPVASAPAEPVLSASPEPPAELHHEVTEALYDDLTTIPGIGPALQRRLRNAGMGTYAQLAASTPESIRQCLGEVAQLAKVEDWIAAAQKMISAS